MTAEPSAPLPTFAAEWVGGDIRGLHALATTMYEYLPEIAGVTTVLDQEVSQLTGGEPGWHGPAADAFTAAWRRDADSAKALAAVIGQAARVIGGLAVELAVIEKALEEEAHTAARYGVRIGTDGRPPPLPYAGPPDSAAEASERHWARAYRQAYEQAMADARRARTQAAGRLRELYVTTVAAPEPCAQRP
jgi:uncharacterized protein YukE